MHTTHRNHLSQRKFTQSKPPSQTTGRDVLTLVIEQKALNLFNAALVTPTYYVYFTSSTIVASAVLFQGLHGTVIQIMDVVLGFLVICSGVILLQLAKSSKDVPDAAVFKGDLDQVREVAEVEEPESEPRADTIRGGAGIVRAMSKIRTKRQAEEVKRIHDERMEPIGEGEEFEWDGLRRRKTVSSLGRSAAGSVVRRKTVHPPLGMSHFPEDDAISEPDSEVHPGFFGRIGRKSQRSLGAGHKRAGSGRSPVPLGSVSPVKTTVTGPDGSMDVRPEHVYGLPPGLSKHDGREDDTSYKGPGSASEPQAHIRFVSDAQDSRERASSRGSSLAPPQPPPHARPAHAGGRRTFSFQNPFHRRSHTDADADDRPTSRGALSFTSRGSNAAREYPTGNQTTEEERLGLVQGDSSNATLPRYTEVPEEEEGERRSSSDDWQLAGGSSPEQLGGHGGDLGRQRRRDPYESDEEGRELYDEPLRSPVTRDDPSGRGGGRGGGAFV